MTYPVKLRKATDRRTQAHIVDLPNGVEILFSYETPVAFRTPRLYQWQVTPTRYSNTTARHKREVLTGNPHVWPTQEAFDLALALAVSLPAVELVEA